MTDNRMINGRDIHSLRCWYRRNCGRNDDKEIEWMVLRMPLIIEELELLHDFRKISNQTFKQKPEKQ